MILKSRNFFPMEYYVALKKYSQYNVLFPFRNEITFSYSKITRSVVKEKRLFFL